MAKKNEKEPAFDWQEELTNREISNMLKAGVKYYIEFNKLSVKSDKDLDKVIDDYLKIEMGD